MRDEVIVELSPLVTSVADQVPAPTKNSEIIYACERTNDLRLSLSKTATV